MNFEQRLQLKILLGYLVTFIIGISMFFILLHKRERVGEIKAGAEIIRQMRLDISDTHRHITRLAMLG